MADHSYDTPTQERRPVPSAREVDFPNIQGGRYQFVEIIGEGGSGAVFRAHDTVLDKAVAIKKLHSTQSETTAVRFQREARLIGSLKHDNVLSALDFGMTSSNEPYLVLDYVAGTSLSRFLRTAGYLLPRDAVPLFIQIAAGLQHAHKNNVIHRDIKPSNVMLVTEVDTTSGEEHSIAKIVDFGLAKTVDAGEPPRITEDSLELHD